MWLMPGGASGCKNYAVILFINTPEEEMLLRRSPAQSETDHKPMLYISLVIR